jgi:DNA polymerase
MDVSSTRTQWQADAAPGDRLADVRTDAEGCRRCPLYKDATHLVFGEGNDDARVLLVGEQPGDKEDLAAKPFVGPAGRLLDVCLEEAGIDRGLCYVTNAVKHFKFTPRGKRRIHAKPNTGEIKACAWWLNAERQLIKPRLTVALGATAAYSLLGPKAKVTRDRGQVLKSSDGGAVLMTIHPSYLLRLPEPEDRDREKSRFVDDLRRIDAYLG